MSAQGRITEYGIKHAQISELLEDDPTAAAPVYGPAIDVPGIRGLSFEIQYAKETLTGDDKNLDVQASVESITLEIEHGMLSHEVKAIVQGGTHTKHAGPSGKSTSIYTQKGGSESKAWKIEGVLTKTSSPGSVSRFTAFKCKATSASEERSNGTYKTNTFSAEGVATLSSDDVYTDIEQEGGNQDDTQMQGPQVDHTSPVHGATDVPLNANIVITFDKAMDSAFNDDDFFTVFDVTSNSSVSIATPTYASNAWTLNPADFGAGKKIKVTASGALRDAVGNPLGVAYEFEFTTAAS